MPNKIVVIGGVAAGPKAAARARRVDPEADITIIEKEEILSYAGCGLPYWISGVVKDKKELISTPIGVMRDPKFFAKAKDIKALNRTKALEIDREKKVIYCENVGDGNKSEVPYDKLVIATGSEPIELKIDGANLKNVTQLKDPDDAAALHEAFSKACHRVTIVGGGLIGCEMTEAVRECGKHVTIVEMQPHLLPGLLDADLTLQLEKSLREEGITIHTNSKVEKFLGNDNGRVRKVVTDDGKEIDTEFVLVAVGVRPVVGLARDAGLEIGESGGIRVNSHMQTSDPDIYAAGDCVEHLASFVCELMLWPMGSVANKEGRVAGTNVAGGEEIFRGIVGTNVLNVFNQNVGRSGLTTRGCEELGLNTTTAVIASPDRAHYFPTAKPIILKAIVETKTRRLLGVQGIGAGGVVKRMDVAAAAIMNDMTIDEVANLDLGYAPPYSSAMDPLITLANVARNKIDGLFDGISVLEVKEKFDAGEDFLLLDVRSKGEYETSQIPGSTLIPLGELRDRLDELPRDKDLVTMCKISLRGYEAARILHGAGFENVKVMEGGLLAWPYETENG